jgi:hypothetical protein
LVDSAGNVLATKTLSGPSDVTEVTVGSDYLIRFDNFTHVVNPGSDSILAVRVNVLAASDKITGQTVYFGIPSGSIRTENGKGYTDSLGLTSGQGSAATSASGNAVVLSSTGSTGTIYTRISPSAPTQRIETVTSNNTKTDVNLGVFSVKSQNQAATLSAMSFNLNFATATAAYATTTAVSNVRLKVGATSCAATSGQTYGSNNLTAGNTTFTNMSVALPNDAWVDVTLCADINANQSNFSASSTLVAASIVGVDSNFNTVTLTNASNVTSSDVQFLTAGVNVSNASATLGAPIYGYGTAAGATAYNATFTFTLANTGSTDVYVARSPGSMLGTTSSSNGTGGSIATSTITNVTVSSDPLPGDSASTLAYVIPTGGTRTFTFTGRLGNPGGTGTTGELKITSIYFNSVAASVGATSSATAGSITFGLGSLKVNATF